MEISQEKSEEQAIWLKLLNVSAYQLDEAYLREVAKQTREQARHQETLIIFMPQHPLEKIQALYSKADALNALCDYLMHIKKVAQYEKEASDQLLAREQLNHIFNT